MKRITYFFIDDVIWFFRDLTREQPKSMFDNPFLKVLKSAHDRYGMKIQLNVFYRTDFYYGDDEFTLADMTDRYKDEWIEASDWLKLGFHAKQEFPDYPYINASYDDVKANLEDIKSEVFRFAGPKSFAYATVCHWLPMSREGCIALRDGGIKIMDITTGERYEYNGDPFSLPYGHAGRLLQNRKPESKLFKRGTRDKAIDASLCGYNHLTEDIVKPIKFTLDAYYDKEIGMYFKELCNGPCLNLNTMESLKEDLLPLIGREYIGYGLHEQYFYPDYYAFQEDYADKIYLAAEILSQNEYSYFFAEDLV